MDFSSIKVCALLDSKAFICFIDKDLADPHKLSLVANKHPIPVEVIEGRPLVSGESPSNPVVLGLSWLNKYNPTIDWKTRRIKDWLFSQTLLQSKNLVIG
jgi:hypothetical protein